ncbi:MAG: hypothetical protein A2033_09515 [Bacteroidetes bacterium GWA2_31_9]|nr:MAG: hypothetical protein A2033_09515 [Bacteroidetes bacterium GWA2_31_9]
MKDLLEEYIKNNRESFDLHETPPNIWNKISNTADKRNFSKYTWLSIAASILVIISVSIFYYTINNQNTVNKISASIDSTQYDLPTEIQEAEVFYTTLINKKMIELGSIENSDSELMSDVNSDFSQLDSIYKDLKKELNSNVANEELLEAMIQNYRTKLSILEELLTTIQSKNIAQNENNKQVEL